MNPRSFAYVRPELRKAEQVAMLGPRRNCIARKLASTQVA
jgi:hypothetical protein